MARIAAALWIAGWLLASPLAAAEPVDLGNREPRWIWIRFEVSPPDQPASTDARYSPPQSAWLEPTEDGAALRVTLPGATVESQLLASEEPVAGSFSDFRWSIDPGTGHVLSATLEGTVMRRLDFGIATARVPAKLRFEMSTLRPAGFRSKRRLLGQPVNRYCVPDPSSDCVAVPPRRYDPATGYVNAVGSVAIDSRIMRLTTFSTLGEARLSEVAPVGTAPRGEPGLPATDRKL